MCEATQEATRLYQPEELVPALAGLRSQLGPVQGEFDRERTLLEEGIKGCQAERRKHAAGEPCRFEIAKVIQEQATLETELEAICVDHEQHQEKAAALERELLALIALMNAGIDVVRFQVAGRLVGVENAQLPPEDMHRAEATIEGFVRWVVAGCPKRACWQSGTPRFQLRGTPPYQNYPPDAMLCEIWLRDGVEARVRDFGLSADELDAVIYYCANLVTGKIDAALDTVDIRPAAPAAPDAFSEEGADE